MTERESLIQAAEEAWQREADFRAYYCAHFGLAPGSHPDDLEAITSALALTNSAMSSSILSSTTDWVCRRE